LIKIDKSAQRMTVTAAGKPVHNWPVSTGRSGYDTPSGRFKPFRMDSRTDRRPTVRSHMQSALRRRT
jgi:hypothetical protein